MHNLIYTYVLHTVNWVFYNLHGVHVLSTSGFFFYFFGNCLLDKKISSTRPPLHNMQISISTFFSEYFITLVCTSVLSPVTHWVGSWHEQNHYYFDFFLSILRSPIIISFPLFATVSLIVVQYTLLKV